MTASRPIEQFNIDMNGAITPKPEFPLHPKESLKRSNSVSQRRKDRLAKCLEDNAGSIQPLIQESAFKVIFCYPRILNYWIPPCETKVCFDAHCPELVGNNRQFEITIGLTDFCMNGVDRALKRQECYRFDYLIMGLYDCGYSIANISKTLRDPAIYGSKVIRVTTEEIYRCVRKYTARPWTDNQMPKIEAFVTKGYDLVEISKELEIPSQYLREAVKIDALPREPKTLAPKERVAQAQLMREQGYSLAEISNATGLQVSTLRSYGIKGRTNIPRGKTWKPSEMRFLNASEQS